ncbi:cysteine-rich and transmembrane domain-containing protein WIH1-like isoform X2 [Salvia splendens]|uniref:cysteine-rich and transmembrane domain-containing protein WIH1-like isoform X2 n=1 Tax=Salvia splendens TaxID=180675 RepID=UPI001C271FF5|nr:cysteine-rich and transmembrane domain-containing protein WIH1-like isoform X2 [Salvia splendens]
MVPSFCVYIYSYKLILRLCILINNHQTISHTISLHAMSNYNQPQAYPPPGTAAAYPVEPPGGYMAPPPQAGFAVNDPPADTQSRGDGFWRGCCAGLCCCCLLDACF